MKAMVLAAGLGKRLRPLTLETPKPLISVGGRPLVEYQLEKLCQAGVEEVVVNLHHLGEQIEKTLGDGSRLGLNIQYSRETELLETGGGILRALPLLGDEPFLCISGDTYSEFDLSLLPENLPEDSLGLMVMTDNPPHHPSGDFQITDDGVLKLASSDDSQTFTYTGVAIFSPELVQGESEDSFPLRQVFDKAIAAGRMHGICFTGYWCDVGTMDRLEELRAHVQS